MEGILSFVSIIIIVFGILQIILFFKLWGMTNNVNEMKNMMESYLRKELQNKNVIYQEKEEETSQNTIFESDIKIDDLVVELKSERQLKVSDITEDSKYKCRTVSGISSAGIFDRSEIELSDRYWKNSNNIIKY